MRERKKSRMRPRMMSWKEQSASNSFNDALRSQLEVRMSCQAIMSNTARRSLSDQSRHDGHAYENALSAMDIQFVILPDEERALRVFFLKDAQT